MVSSFVLLLPLFPPQAAGGRPPQRSAPLEHSEAPNSIFRSWKTRPDASRTSLNNTNLTFAARSLSFLARMAPRSGTDGETEYRNCTYNRVRPVTIRHRTC